jgi:hypothetical protein
MNVDSEPPKSYVSNFDARNIEICRKPDSITTRNSSIIFEWKDRACRLHRDYDLPAVIEYSDIGHNHRYSIEHCMYYDHGQGKKTTMIFRRLSGVLYMKYSDEADYHHMSDFTPSTIVSARLLYPISKMSNSGWFNPLTMLVFDPGYCLVIGKLVDGVTKPLTNEDVAICQKMEYDIHDRFKPKC